MEKEKQIFIPVPAGTDPNDLGNLVREALQKNYCVTISEGTARAITMTAVDKTKEQKAGFKEVEIRVGPSWFGFTVKWGK